MRCPVCRAEVEEGPQCRRCRADLTFLFAVLEQQTAAIEAGYVALGRGDLPDAEKQAERAVALRRDQEARKLVLLVHLLRHAFPAAWRAYLGVREEKPDPAQAT